MYSTVWQRIYLFFVEQNCVARVVFVRINSDPLLSVVQELETLFLALLSHGGVMRACVDGGIAAVFRELGQVRQGKVDVFESVQQENSSHDRSETCTECKFLRKKITSAHALQSTGKDK